MSVLQHMTNKEIATQFNFLGDIMELHGENTFKIRSYRSAYRNLRSLPEPLHGMTDEEIGGLKGVGKAISGKIQELLTTGEMQTLEKYKDKTPPGVQEMLGIKGFGPKKIKVIWKELGAESIGEWLYAVNENRLVELKGFGEKTQADLKKKLEYYKTSIGKFRLGTVLAAKDALLERLRESLQTGEKIDETGDIRRRCNVVEAIEIIVGSERDWLYVIDKVLMNTVATPDGFAGESTEGFPVKIFTCSPSEYGTRQLQLTGNQDFVTALMKLANWDDLPNVEQETDLFAQANLKYIEPELREDDWAIELAQADKLPKLLVAEDIKGVIHSHTTYSDGGATLRQMAEYSRDQGYEYIGITDHSQAAFYANGLKPDRVLKQMAEIDELNAELAPFKILKGIECDILANGDLDYDDDILAKFDFIIASVHSNLRMDKEKATQRILKAVENPFTSMLGHPTGRLILSREGYPLDHQRIIDACAANNVSIELNASPYRLDLDWSWIPYAREKGVLISINPDAHSLVGIHDIKYGTLSARKGGLDKEGCINARGWEDFLAALKK
ncbi:MAG: PHP domain-containing protein [Saprospiraceae bacterium]